MTIAPWPKIKNPKPLRSIDGGTQLANDILFLSDALDLIEAHDKLVREAKNQAKVARRTYTAADRMLKRPGRCKEIDGLLRASRKRAYDHTMMLKKAFGRI